MEFGWPIKRFGALHSGGHLPYLGGGKTLRSVTLSICTPSEASASELDVRMGITSLQVMPQDHFDVSLLSHTFFCFPFSSFPLFFLPVHRRRTSWWQERTNERTNETASLLQIRVLSIFKSLHLEDNPRPNLIGYAPRSRQGNLARMVVRCSVTRQEAVPEADSSHESEGLGPCKVLSLRIFLSHSLNPLLLFRSRQLQAGEPSVRKEKGRMKRILFGEMWNILYEK